MKTKAAFASILGLMVATSFLASSTAEAQMKTSVAKKATAKTTLKTKIKSQAKVEEAKSPFSLNISETLYGKPKNEENYLEHYLTGSVDLMENVSFSLESGFESHLVKTEKNSKNTAYDLEANLTVSGIEIAKDFKFKTGLIGVLPTSRSSRDQNMAFGYGIRAGFSLKLGGVSLGVDNSFYQLSYKTAPVATPDEVQFDDTEKRFYTNEFTRATTILSASIPVGPLSWKNDLRIRQSTPYAGEEKRPMRFRTRLAYGIADGLTVLGGVSWQKNMIDQKAPEFFADKNRTLWFTLSLDV